MNIAWLWWSIALLFSLFYSSSLASEGGAGLDHTMASFSVHRANFANGDYAKLLADHLHDRGHASARGRLLNGHSMDERTMEHEIRTDGAHVQRFVHLGPLSGNARGLMMAVPLYSNPFNCRRCRFAILSAKPAYHGWPRPFDQPTIWVHGFADVTDAPGIIRDIRTSSRPPEAFPERGHDMTANEVFRLLEYL